MRSSSVKPSVVSAVALVAVLSLSAPSADARPAQSRETRVTRSESRGALDRLARGLRRLLESFTSNFEEDEGLPSTPVPNPRNAT